MSLSEPLNKGVSSKYSTPLREQSNEIFELLSRVFKLSLLTLQCFD